MPGLTQEHFSNITDFFFFFDLPPFRQEKNYFACCTNRTRPLFGIFLINPKAIQNHATTLFQETFRETYLFKNHENMEVNTENKFEFNPKMIARIMQFVILG